MNKILSLCVLLLVGGFFQGCGNYQGPEEIDVSKCVGINCEVEVQTSSKNSLIPTRAELNQICAAILSGRSQSPLSPFSGQLCAIQPSHTHEKIVDADGPLGYGYHVLGIPDNLSADTPLWIHFSGAYGRPYDQSKRKFNAQAWLGEIVDQGYLVISLAINNSFSFNATYCKDTNEDGCVWKLREDIATGSNYSHHVSMDYTNSVLGRVSHLIKYLDAKGFPLPENLNSTTTWKDILAGSVLSGHSQGAGYAFYLGKYQKIRGACAFGGPGDPADNNKPFVDENGFKVADWIVDGRPVNPLDQYFALSLDTDPWHLDHEAGWKGYGLKNRNNYQILEARGLVLTNTSGEDISDDGHGAVIGAVELKEERAKCFSHVKAL